MIPWERRRCRVPGQCRGAQRGGGWGEADGATREEKTGPSAGFPACYLLLLKINDALERFHFVSLTGRPRHQPGRRSRHRSRLLLSPSSLCCSPPRPRKPASSSPAPSAPRFTAGLCRLLVSPFCCFYSYDLSCPAPAAAGTRRQANSCLVLRCSRRGKRAWRC